MGMGNGLGVWDRTGFEQHGAREITSAVRGRSRATPLPKCRESGTSVSISAPRDVILCGSPRDPARRKLGALAA